MKHILLSLLFAGTGITAYGQDFVLNGRTYPSNDGRVALLVSTDDKGGLRLMQSAIVRGGVFRFEGKAYPGSFSIVALDSYSPLFSEAKIVSMETEVVLEKGTISVVLDSLSYVSGTPMNDLLREYKAISGFELDKVVDFIKNNNTNIVGVRAFTDYMPRLSDEDVESILAVDPKLKDNAKIRYNLESRKIVSHIRQNKTARQQMKGSKFMDFEVYTLQGDTVAISDYVGRSKYLVLDFWASWCGLCQASMPHMKAIAAKYKDRGVEFLGVSLDTQEDKGIWVSVVKRIDAPWPQVSDFGGMRSDLAKAYAVGDIPYVVIISRDGKLVDFVRFPHRQLEIVLDRLP